MIEPLGICRLNGKPLCRIRLGDNLIEMSKIGKKIFSSLNGRVLFRAKSEKELYEKCLPTVSAVMSSLCKRGGHKKIKFASHQSGPEEILKNIRLHLEPVEISVLESKPDEIEENTPKQSTEVLSRALSGYKEYLKSCARNIEAVSAHAGNLLRTEVKKSMWGSKEVTAVLHGVKNSMVRLAEDSEAFDGYIEKAHLASRHMQDCFVHADLKGQAQETASKIIEGFSNIKTYASELTQNLYGLRDIDRVCKAHTGYPATFLMSSQLMDFMYEYDTLVDHMIKTATIESHIIEPLLVWKIRKIQEQSNGR
jgi:hypothetical protein